jgi:hypothetical protein
MMETIMKLTMVAALLTLEERTCFSILLTFSLLLAAKTNLPKDWRSYWFYLKVDMSKVPDYTGPTYPLYSPMAPMTAITTATYNDRTLGFKNCENAFFLANTILGCCDVIGVFYLYAITKVASDLCATKKFIRTCMPSA